MLSSLYMGWIPVNFKISFSSLICHFWGKITKWYLWTKTAIIEMAAIVIFFFIFLANENLSLKMTILKFLSSQSTYRIDLPFRCKVWFSQHHNSFCLQERISDLFLHFESLNYYFLRRNIQNSRSIFIFKSKF